MSATPLYGRCYRCLFYLFFLNSVFSIFTKEKCAIDSAKSPSPLFENRLRVLCYVFQQRNERNAQHGDSLKPVRLVRRKMPTTKMLHILALQLMYVYAVQSKELLTQFSSMKNLLFNDEVNRQSYDKCKQVFLLARKSSRFPNRNHDDQSLKIDGRKLKERTQNCCTHVTHSPVNCGNHFSSNSGRDCRTMASPPHAPVNQTTKRLKFTQNFIPKNKGCATDWRNPRVPRDFSLTADVHRVKNKDVNKKPENGNAGRPRHT